MNAERLIVHATSPHRAEIERGEFTFGNAIPRRFRSGDVLVYRLVPATRFEYLGVLEAALLDEVGGRLRGWWQAFSSPVVAFDISSSLSRRDLVESHNGFGRDDFNYITEDAFQAVLATARVSYGRAETASELPCCLTKRHTREHR